MNQRAVDGVGDPVLRAAPHPATLPWIIGLAGDRPHSAIVALSGGADSVCLTALLARCRASALDTLTAVHVDHAQRGPAAAATDLEVCQKVCRRLGVRLEVCRLALAPEADEAAMRASRLAALHAAAAAAGAAVVFFGHHAGDVLETQLMRLATGAGLAGMAAPAPVHVYNEQYTHVRPLLDCRPPAIRQWLVANGLPWAEDPSNRSPAHTRNRVRHQVIPALEAAMPQDVYRGALRSRALAAETEAALIEYLDRQPLDYTAHTAFDAAPLAGQPQALWRRALFRWLGRHPLVPQPRGAVVDRLLPVWMAGQTASFSCGAGRITVANWCLRYEPAVTCSDGNWRPAGWPTACQLLALPNGGLLRAEHVTGDEARLRLAQRTIDPARNALIAGADSRFEVRPWRAGDRYLPLGAPGQRKLKDCFCDRRIAQQLRHQLPVVVAGDGTILWVPGLLSSEFRRITPASNEALQLTYHSP
jgi:tRNA(Ile)-lysidine synthase